MVKLGQRFSIVPSIRLKQDSGMLKSKQSIENCKGKKKSIDILGTQGKIAGKEGS
jgi:hypothetical protein